MRLRTILRQAAIAALSGTLLVALPAHLAANPVLLFDPDSGTVLHAEAPDHPWHPASVTKLMTAYLTFEEVKAGRLAWDADVPLSEYARSQPATRIGLRGGIRINVEQAVRGLILRSANDFAVALAERVGGNEEAFVERMNATAVRLAMTRTRFKNPHGLPDPEQVTTARDMALLTTALLKDFPDRAEVFSTPTVVIHKGTFHSQNDLLRTLEGADGMKTGFTCASGYNVVASATRNGRRLVAVVMGALNRTTRSERAAELLEVGFAHLAGQPAPNGSTVPTPLTPVALKDMPLSPAEPPPPHDMARETRTRKCGNSERIVRRTPTDPAVGVKAAAAGALPLVTGSVAQPRPKRHRALRKATTPSAPDQGDEK